MARSAKGKTPSESTELAVLDTNSTEWLAELQRVGLVNPAMGGTSLNFIRISGNVVMYDGEPIAEYSQIKKEPALYVQLTGMPKEYQGLWFDKPENAARADSNARLASLLGRDGTIPGTPSIEGRWCRSWFDDESQNRKFAEDGTSCDTCAVHPWVPKEKLPAEAKGKRCGWRARLEFRILNKQEDGTLNATDDTLYTIDLSTTGVIEFKGTGRNPLEGSASPKSSIAELAELGYSKWGRPGIEKAKTLLDLGGVICELHIIQQANDARSWETPHFRPVEILELEEQKQLPPPPANEELTQEEVPF